MQADPYSEGVSEIVWVFRAMEIDCATFWQGMEQLWREGGKRFVRERKARCHVASEFFEA